MSPGGYGSSDVALGKKFSEAIAANSRDQQVFPAEELREAWNLFFSVLLGTWNSCELLYIMYNIDNRW